MEQPAATAVKTAISRIYVGAPKIKQTYSAEKQTVMLLALKDGNTTGSHVIYPVCFT